MKSPTNQRVQGGHRAAPVEGDDRHEVEQVEQEAHVGQGSQQVRVHLLRQISTARAPALPRTGPANPTLASVQASFGMSRIATIAPMKGMNRADRIAHPGAAGSRGPSRDEEQEHEPEADCHRKERVHTGRDQEAEGELELEEPGQDQPAELDDGERRRRVLPPRGDSSERSVCTGPWYSGSGGGSRVAGASPRGVLAHGAQGSAPPCGASVPSLSHSAALEDLLPQIGTVRLRVSIASRQAAMVAPPVSGRDGGRCTGSPTR